MASSRLPSVEHLRPLRITHVLGVEIFFQIALASSQISKDRPSNRTDIAYLFYLPFSAWCSFRQTSFTGRARHCSFGKIRKFVWGLDLKADLRALNSHYSQLPDAEKEKGLLHIARLLGGYRVRSSVGRLWKRHLKPVNDYRGSQRQIGA